MKPMQGNQWVNCAFGCLFKKKKKKKIYIVLWDFLLSIYIQHVSEHTEDPCLPHPTLPILKG